MPRRKITFVPGSYYHLYNRGHNRQNIFFKRENYLFFLTQFRRYFIDEGILEVIAYCLMPNHYHFLVRLRTDDLSFNMQGFTLSYTKAMNRRYERCGSLFQGRFHAILVEQTDYLLTLTRYIHLNPVKARFVDRPEDWEFSSYPEYVGLRQGTLPKLDALGQQWRSPTAYQGFMADVEVASPTVLNLMLDL